MSTSSGQHLLLKNDPRKPESRRHQTVLVEVSSRDRNYMQLILSNPFRFTFQRPLKDVRSVELIGGTIPANPYNVDKHYNQFTFQEGTTQWLITLPPATYTYTTLLSALTTAITSLSGLANTYSFSQDTNTQAFVTTRLTGSAVFSYLFGSGIPSDLLDKEDGSLQQINTPASILGFDFADYACDSSGILTSPFPMDLFSLTSRLYLYINLENTLSLNVIERGVGRRSPYAILYLDQSTNGYKFLNKDTVTPVCYSLPQPLSRLQTLQIEFRDEFYRIVHFNGKDFSLLFQFTTLE